MKPKKIFSWLSNNIMDITVASVFFIGLALAAVLSAQTTTSYDDNIPQKFIDFFIILSLSVLAGTSSKFTNLNARNSGANFSEGQALDARLLKLTNALTQAGNAISSIEKEINSRQELVEKLEKQKGIAEEAIKLSKEQVDAVSALLSEQVAKQSRRDARVDWIKQIIFFILGVLATIFLTKLGFG